MRFQSTLPRRERPFPPSPGRPLVHFNPRSREGSDDAIVKSTDLRKISIHAPAKGATSRHSIFQALHSDFNPRSREGSDDLYDTYYRVLGDFNPRSREGSDGSSIPLQLTSSNFNPRSREGSDNRPPFIALYLVIFQSTLPRRERQCRSENERS